MDRSEWGRSREAANINSAPIVDGNRRTSEVDCEMVKNVIVCCCFSWSTLECMKKLFYIFFTTMQHVKYARRDEWFFLWSQVYIKFHGQMKLHRRHFTRIFPTKSFHMEVSFLESGCYELNRYELKRNEGWSRHHDMESWAATFIETSSVTVFFLLHSLLFSLLFLLFGRSL